MSDSNAAEHEMIGSISSEHKWGTGTSQAKDYNQEQEARTTRASSGRRINTAFGQTDSEAICLFGVLISFFQRALHYTLVNGIGTLSVKHWRSTNTARAPGREQWIRMVLLVVRFPFLPFSVCIIPISGIGVWVWVLALGYFERGIGEGRDWKRDSEHCASGICER